MKTLTENYTVKLPVKHWQKVTSWNCQWNTDRKLHSETSTGTLTESYTVKLPMKYWQKVTLWNRWWKTTPSWDLPPPPPPEDNFYLKPSPSYFHANKPLIKTPPHPPTHTHTLLWLLGWSKEGRLGGMGPLQNIQDTDTCTESVSSLHRNATQHTTNKPRNKNKPPSKPCQSKREQFCREATLVEVKSASHSSLHPITLNYHAPFHRKSKLWTCSSLV